MIKGVITAASFIVFGSVPLLIFLFKGRLVGSSWSPPSPLGVSTLASAVTMFILGAVAGPFTEQNVVKSGGLMVCHGLLAAYAAYFLGEAMEDYGAAAAGNQEL